MYHYFEPIIEALFERPVPPRVAIQLARIKVEKCNSSRYCDSVSQVLTCCRGVLELGVTLGLMLWLCCSFHLLV